MVENVKIGQMVWFKDDRNNAKQGIVTAICFYKSGKDVLVNVGGYSERVEIKDCYPTKKDLLKTFDIGQDMIVRTYCGCIQTVQDLVQFCYDRNLSADLIAKRAAEIRAKELLGIELR